MDGDLGFRRGPCIRHDCPGQVAFEVGGATHRVPGGPDVEAKSCHVCGLLHDREVESGLVAARWTDEASRPVTGEGYYLR